MSIRKKIIAIMMAWVMLLILPLANVAPVSEAAGDSASGEAVSNTTDDGSSGEDTDSDKTDAKNDKKESDKEDDISGIDKVYISEVRIGMGETDAEAKKELEAEGFTILKDDGGKNADLNKDAGSKSALKRGANDKIVYLGYKTTTDPNDGITDLAVMNMKGGYSIEDYNILMDQQMNTQIKPFVERFVATLDEYRKNYKKPKSSINYIRANYMRKMMNLLTDDDTGGQPMGDLLLNKTKFELGDAEYNKLSDSEKKKHCDILTLLMQANGQATMSLETLLTKAADTSDDTWVDRMAATTLDDLMDQVESENPNLTTKTDLLQELDRLYNDDAKKILSRWDSLKDKIDDLDDIADEFADKAEENMERVEELEGIDLLKASDSEFDEYIEAKKQSDELVKDGQTIMICSYLSSVEYEDDTLLEFFSQDSEKLLGTNEIRKLYPLVDALSAGQIAGLEFVSIEDLITIAISDEEAYKNMEKNMDDVKATSVYENVNREIYEKGGVALTNDSLRAKAASASEESTGYKLGTLPAVLWGVTTGALIGTIASTVARSIITKSPVFKTNWDLYRFVNDPVTNTYKGIWNNPVELEKARINVVNNSDKIYDASAHEYVLRTRVQEINDQGGAGTVSEATKGAGNIAKYLSIGMAVITVIMTIVSTVMTILDASKFYDTEYIPMPKYIVEESDITATNAKGQETMIKNQTAYYKVVRCNRTAGDNKITKKNFEVMGDANDLNGDIGSQWYSLYSVKYVNGAPILADSLLYQINGTTVPDGYSTGIHDFGAKAACNLNKKAYLFRTNPPQIKVFFKRDKIAKDLKATGSTFTPGSMAIGCGMGLIVGALLGGVVVGRRKKKVEAENEA